MTKDFSIQVLDKSGKKAGTMELSPEIFAVRWSPDAVHQVVQAYSANSRKSVAHVKGRGEVSGGGKKPWRQKGTGRARHGSSRSPIWIGGGVTFGPTNERIFSKKINRKMKRFALASLLSKKFADGEVYVFDNLTIEPAKTKEVVAVVKNASLPNSLLFVKEGKNTSLLRAARNIPKTDVVSAANLNAADCMLRKAVVFERPALEALAASFKKEKVKKE